jgi:hypothetical protein
MNGRSGYDSHVLEIMLCGLLGALRARLFGPRGCKQGRKPYIIRLLQFWPRCGYTQLGQPGFTHAKDKCRGINLGIISLGEQHMKKY